VDKYRFGAAEFATVVASLALAACSSDKMVTTAAVKPAAAEPAPPPTASAPPAEMAAPTPPAPDPRAVFADWLRARMPAGGRVVVDGDNVGVVHTASATDTPESIAKAYLDLSAVYRARDLAALIAKANPTLKAGTEITLPKLIAAPYKNPEEDRLRWPPQRALRGIFVTGIFAANYWPETIEKLQTHGLNAIVVDGKDYSGPLQYPSHAKVALETAAAARAPITDLSRAIRYAHAHGVHVIVRVPCFHDPWTASRAPRLALRNVNGTPSDSGWLDPSNTEAQDYIIEVVNEVLALGADELQLDYVRFPVQDVANAVMPAADGHRTQTMRAFVARVHAVTQAANVPLSLDTFGITATGAISDVEKLGQNLSALGSASEAVSPMIYPSHYAEGFHGWENPGDHPEIIGIGTKGAVDRLKAAKIEGTVVRPWLQASEYKTTKYGPQYVRDEIASAEANGAVGWLLWNPSSVYWAVWDALPKVSPEKPATAAR
jgi:hypothetical protein